MCAAYDPAGAPNMSVHAVRNGNVHHGVFLCCFRKFRSVYANMGLTLLIGA
jgi:hypothetical protein